jgi:hypothetical protein
VDFPLPLLQQVQEAFKAGRPAKARDLMHKALGNVFPLPGIVSHSLEPRFSLHQLAHANLALADVAC